MLGDKTEKRIHNHIAERFACQAEVFVLESEGSVGMTVELPKTHFSYTFFHLIRNHII